MANEQNRNVGSSGTGDMTFRCSDVHPSCNWEARGRNEQDLRRQIEQHGREHHNMREMAEDTWNKIKNKFRRAA